MYVYEYLSSFKNIYKAHYSYNKALKNAIFFIISAQLTPASLKTVRIKIYN